MSRLHHSLSVAILGWSLACAPAWAQTEQLASADGRAGREKVGKLVDRSVRERTTGKLPQAIESAQQGAAEAERLGLDVEMGGALLELSKAQLATGNGESAMRSAIKALRLLDDSSDLLRAPALLQLADVYLSEGYPAKALEYTAEVDPKALADAGIRAEHLRLASQAKAKTLWPGEALQAHRTALTEAERLGDKRLQHELRMLMASAAARSNQTKLALELERTIMERSMLVHDFEQAGISLNNIGELQLRSGATDEGLASLQRATILLEDHPGAHLSSLMNLAQGLSRAGEHAKAQKVLDEAVQEAKADGRQAILPKLHRTRATVYLSQSDLGNAYSKALEALEAAEAVKNEAEQNADCELLVAIAERMGQSSEARLFSKRAREHAQHVSDQLAQERREHENNLLRLQRLEREETEGILVEQRRVAEMRELALNADNKEKQLALMTYEMQLKEASQREAFSEKERAEQALQLAEAELETERQERMIKDLDHTRQMQNANMDRLKFEQKEHEHSMDLLAKQNELMQAESQMLAADRQRDRLMKWGSVGLAAIALAAAGFMTWAWVAQRRKKRTIWRQHQHIRTINEELADKNASIQSGISYARTIQSAILPTEQSFNEAMPGSFLFYRPLDTVSGDLPFVKRIGDRVFVAAIDCTGHGVPAAMMTFIAYYGLSELIGQTPNADCGSLLDRLHEHVKQTMESRSGTGLYNDGMDIGLCSIDLKNGKLSFAGAQLPLVLIRQGKLERVKGDVLPLGDGHFERKSGYRNHEMTLEPNDTLYLYSDGLIHQFGGPQGRSKFSQRRLFEALAGMDQEDLATVKERTVALFESWKGDTPQTDDILMIGMRYAA